MQIRNVSIEEELARWSATRPTWQQDVLARLCRNEIVDDDVVRSIARLLLAGEGGDEKKIEPADIPGGSSSMEPVCLQAVRDVTGVGALTEGQTLTFSPAGLTVIYGDNASGKSGYARLVRNAVAARIQSELLSNVFDTSRAKTPQGVLDYQVGSTPGEWKLGEALSADLTLMHFYDQECGSAYISTASEVSYRPSALTLLDKLVKVCDAVASVLNEALAENQQRRSALPIVTQGTRAAVFLSSLSSGTRQTDIDKETNGADVLKDRLAKLLPEEARLRSSDPVKEKQRLESLAASIATIADECDRISSALSKDAVAQLVTIRDRAQSLREAAKVASTKTFDAEPVASVGSRAWRALWQAARDFSISDAYRDHEFPETGPGARCVLCHQTLDESAADRLRRFEAFMLDTTEHDAREAERLLQEARRHLVACQVTPQAVTSAVGRIGDVAEQLPAVSEWLESATGRVSEAITWLDGDSSTPPSSTSNSPTTELRALYDDLNVQAQGIDSSTFTARLQAVTKEVTELQSSLAVTGHKAAIESEVARRVERDRIEETKKLTDTTSITRKSTELTKAYVTRVVRDRFTREADRLKLERITLDPTTGRKGTLAHLPALLNASTAAPVTKVLSEGEQTALGLAGFLTEVEFDGTKSGVVFDDPVTSLDHVRRAIVAKRLVKLASDRQVIVFTHEITFVGELVKHADEAKVAMTERSIARKGTQAGHCSDVHPWKAKDVPARLHELRVELTRLEAERANLDQNVYETRSADWAGKLSETWERAVNLEIVYQVVDRGTSQVKPAKFRIFAKITDADDEDFRHGYGYTSEWARRHDKDPELNFVAPEPSDMKAELDRFESWFKRVKKYRD